MDYMLFSILQLEFQSDIPSGLDLGNFSFKRNFLHQNLSL